jgi:hypothetical protein
MAGPLAKDRGSPERGATPVPQQKSDRQDKDRVSLTASCRNTALTRTRPGNPSDRPHTITFPTETANEELKKNEAQVFFLDLQACCCYGNITLSTRLFAERFEVVQV